MASSTHHLHALNELRAGIQWAATEPINTGVFMEYIMIFKDIHDTLLGEQSKLWNNIYKLFPILKIWNIIMFQLVLSLCNLKP